MQELKILQQIIDTIQQQWGGKTHEERTELSGALWVAQDTLKSLVEGFKAELRASDDTRVETPVGHFKIGKSRTTWKFKEDTDLERVRTELGSMFNVLFYTTLKTTAKFEETLMGLPERQKQMLFDNLEQKSQKAPVSFRKKA
tara:strand:- start:797 stop:1225 length:429 start_codon:yes stop_codon:yes gene_type:complete